MEPITVIDGIRGGVLRVQDRGLAYGHGVFETMRLYGGELPLLSRHRRRLARGLAALSIAVDDDAVDNTLNTLLAASPGDGVIKLTVTAGIGGRGYRAPDDPHPVVIAQWLPLPPIPAAPATLQTCAYRLPINPRLAGLKHLNRLDQVLAARELPPGVHGLMLDAEGHVVEGLSHNLFIHDGVGWRTPPLDRCGVAGVMRALLLEEVMPGGGIQAREAPLLPVDIATARAIFLCNSLAGILPVAVVDGRPVGAGRNDEVLREVVEKLTEKYPCFVA